MRSEVLRAEVLLRLRQANGQVQGAARMVEADRCCVTDALIGGDAPRPLTRP